MMARNQSRSSRRHLRFSPKLLVVGEGKVAEYQYFAQLGQRLKRLGGPGLAPIRPKKNDPVSVVRQVIRRKRDDALHGKFDAQRGDKAYAVLDVDPHDVERQGSLREAIGIARKEEVCILLSNPCFEYWLLCHGARPEVLRRNYTDPSAVDAALRTAFGFGKAELLRDPNKYRELLPRVRDAIAIAKEIYEKNNSGPPDPLASSACTTVYQLVERLVGPPSNE